VVAESCGVLEHAFTAAVAALAFTVRGRLSVPTWTCGWHSVGAHGGQFDRGIAGRHILRDVDD